MPSLTRDIEQLLIELQTEEPRPINDLLIEVKNKNGTLHKNYPSGWKYKRIVEDPLLKGIEQGGVYVFWWLNNSAESLQPFYAPYCERKYTLQGKKVIGTGSIEYHPIEIEITDAWLSQYKGNIPLYVGKSADSILKRMLLHLQINKEKYKGKSTSDQLRRGIERLFKNHPNTADLIVKNVGFSFINLHGPEHVINRFYLEDYAIGKLMPLFNVDVER